MRRCRRWSMCCWTGLVQTIFMRKHTWGICPICASASAPLSLTSTGGHMNKVTDEHILAGRFMLEKQQFKTFEEFVSEYKKTKMSLWSNLRYARDIWHIGFALRLRCPDRLGYFGRGHGKWCWPWQWYRKYYEARYGL